jgi:hypothetical protein
MAEQMTGASGGVGAGEPGAARPSPNVWRWMGGIFADPRSTFEEIAGYLHLPHPTDREKTVDRTRWWLPVLVVVVVSVGVAAYTVPNIVMPGQADMIRSAVLDRGGTTEQAEQAIKMAGAVGIPSGIVGAAVGTFVILFIVAGVIHGLSRLFGGKGKFRTARAIVAYSMLVSALGTLIKLPLMVARKTVMVETGPTLFFPNLEPSDRLYKFLSGFDVFTLWWIVLLGIGLAVGYRLPKARAIVVVLILWVLSVALSMLIPTGGAFRGSM